MTKEETKQYLLNDIKWSYEKSSGAGGQQVNNFRRNRVILQSKELDLVITTGYHRNAIDNREFLLRVFGSVIDDILKQ